MEKVTLVHPRKTFQVSGRLLVQKSDLFADNLTLVGSPYNVTSQVLLSDFQEFISALEGASVKITNSNFGGLSLLCDEFRFRDLARQVSEFRESGEFKEETTIEDSEARKRISALEERMEQHDQEIVVLQSKLSRQAEAHESAVEALLGRVGRLEAEVTALRSTTETVTAPTLTQLQIDLQKLKDATASLAARPPPSAPASPVRARTLPTTSTPPVLPSPSGWNSVIVPTLPEIFAEFKAKKFTVLWRGSRDGFGVRDFHSRCDGHANTLVVILDTKGNIFGGFTPVEWESSRKHWLRDDEDFSKGDPTLKSFLFTLKNPSNFPARRFALRAEKKNEAIYCYSDFGPSFGGDIAVFDNCNNTGSSIYLFGNSYTNDTGLDGSTFFTGSLNFQVKEVEVFEITA
jgi:hypothetical protein